MRASDMNRDQLRKAAAARGIAGRSTMTAEQLRTVVGRAMRSAPAPLTAETRVDNYVRQNGTARLTPRQTRRAYHKARSGR